MSQKLNIEVEPDAKEYLWQLTVFDLGRISQMDEEDKSYWYELRHRARVAMLEAERELAEKTEGSTP